MNRLLLRCAASLVALIAAPALAQRGLKDIPPPDPAAELAAMEVAEGYEVTLFAADPLISKPLHMQFDARGRLWVSSSSIYPQIRPGEEANDTVTILDDTDGDGRADTATRFADGLLMPTAVLPDDRGGAYVANSTELLHFADTDGDGAADTRSVVLSGFGAEDTHHIIHTFRWGPDARMYFNQSIYIHSHVETPQGVKRLNGGGIWRFRPESVALDVFARGWVNAWGHAFDRWGRSLVTDGAGGEGIYYGFPGAAYQAAVGVSRILHGLNPGSPKYCGLEIIDGRHLPDDAQGVLVTNDFRANRVCRFRLTEQGSTFTSTKLPDLIHSKRVTFRPIDVKMGPDGAIYIADWYNPIIQHGEVDFRDERRDRTHGRIWRVVAKGRATLPRIDFTTLTPAELLAQFGAPEGYARDMARRELAVRGREDVLPAVAAWRASLTPQMPDVERLKLEALWLVQGRDGGSAGDVDAALLNEVLASSDPRARAAACRVVPDWADRLDTPVELLAAGVDDAAPLVRLEAVRALARIGGERAAALTLHAVDHPRDEPLDYAVWLAARELRDAWLPAVRAGRFADDGKVGRVVYAVRAAQATEAVPVIVAAVAAGRVGEADRIAALECIAELGTAAELRTVFEHVVAEETPAAERDLLLGRLVETHKRRRIVPAGDLTAIAALVKAADDARAIRGIEAAAAWQVSAAAAAISEIARDADRAADVRQAAIVALGRLPGDEPRGVLVGLASTTGEPAMAAAAIAALVPQSRDEAARQAASFLAAVADQPGAEAVVRAFVATNDGAATLAVALTRSQAAITPQALAGGRAVISGSGRPQPELTAALEGARPGAAATSASGPHAVTPDQFDGFIELVKTKGDRARGEAIYKREALKCASCHRIGDHGAHVGPNLAAIGAASPLDYIIDSLLYPAKNVKEGYNTLVVQTSDGLVVTGIPVSRTDEELVLRDATDKQITIRVADIDEESPGTSLMPAGLVDALSRDELADLVRFLSELGR
jgi:putative heme-binding domain-containing protein